MSFLLYYLLGFAGVLLIAKIFVERIRNEELVIHRTRIRHFESFVSKFVELTANDGWVICDENFLPHTKDDIFNSYLIVRGTDSLSADRVEDIKVKLVLLSCFQKNVGGEPIRNPLIPFLPGGSEYIEGENPLEFSRRILSVEKERNHWVDLQNLSIAESRFYLDSISSERVPSLKCESRRLFRAAEMVLEIGWSIAKAFFITAIGVSLYAVFVGFD